MHGVTTASRTMVVLACWLCGSTGGGGIAEVATLDRSTGCSLLVRDGGYLYSLDAENGAGTEFAIDLRGGALTLAEAHGNPPVATEIRGIAAHDF